MKTYIVNYTNLHTGNSHTTYVEAANLAAAKQLAQRNKNFPDNRKIVTTVKLKRD